MLGSDVATCFHHPSAPRPFPHDHVRVHVFFRTALQDAALRRALCQTLWETEGSGPYYDGGAGPDDEDIQWVDVKEEQDEWEEWEPWAEWEPEADPYEEHGGEHQQHGGEHQQHGGEHPSSSKGDPLPPPPPPPLPGGPEVNPKSLNWDYNSRDRYEWGNRGETWGHGWNEPSWKSWKNKGWHEPWRSTNTKNYQKKAPWAKRKRTAEGQYVKGGFQDHDGNFWQCLVLSSFFVHGDWTWLQHPVIHRVNMIVGPPWMSSDLQRVLQPNSIPIDLSKLTIQFIFYN